MHAPGNRRGFSPEKADADWEGKVSGNDPKRKVTGKTFDFLSNVTEYITVMWYNNGAKGKQVPDAKDFERRGRS